MQFNSRWHCEGFELGSGVGADHSEKGSQCSQGNTYARLLTTWASGKVELWETGEAMIISGQGESLHSRITEEEMLGQVFGTFLGRIHDERREVKHRCV